MKKMIVLLSIVVIALFQFCSSSKKAQAAAPVVNYSANVQSIITTNCSPCHIPPQGRSTPLNTYESAKVHAEDMIARMQRNPEEKGFMPFKHPKLSDSTINVFVQWKNNGFPEN